MLRELAEIGMQLARALLRGASEAPADDEETASAKVRGKPSDPADAFARVSRAVRLTLALEAKTDEALRDLKAGVVREREEARVQAAERAKKDLLERYEDYEHLVSVLVEEAAEAEIEDFREYEAVRSALHERLSEDEGYFDCANRPVRETVERLCNDLGLHPDWSRWDGEGWIVDGPPVRPLYSVFNQPSARPLLPDEVWAKSLAPAPPPARKQAAPHLE